MRINSMFLLFLLILSTACQEKKRAVASKLQSHQTDIDTLRSKLHDFASSKVLPGFAVSIFTADSILYQDGFGMANIEQKIPYQIDNVQIIASVTKTLVGVALMKMVEDGILKLDEDINNILPFRVVNPNFREKKITLRMLASHTSSISGTKKSDKGYRFQSPLKAPDFPGAYTKLLENYNKTDAITMSKFLEYKLSPDGKWYEEEVFLNKVPGAVYEYSNLGITLLAYILEIKTGISFDKYAKDLILDPLKMNSSVWKLNNIAENKHVTYYNELYNRVPDYHIISYPDGGLYSSVSDMTTFLQEMMKGYEGNSKILSKVSFREMMRKQYEDEGLNDGICWDLSFDGLIGHSGNDFGTATLMYFSPKSGIGRILFTNISIETEIQEDTFYGIFNTLFEYDFTI